MMRIIVFFATPQLTFARCAEPSGRTWRFPSCRHLGMGLLGANVYMMRCTSRIAWQYFLRHVQGRSSSCVQARGLSGNMRTPCNRKEEKLAVITFHSSLCVRSQLACTLTVALTSVMSMKVDVLSRCVMKTTSLYITMPR